VSRARSFVVHALIAAIASGSLASIFTGRELWPFLSYPMYAALAGGRAQWFWISGDSDTGEIPLHGYRYLHPAGEQRLGLGLRTLAEQTNGGRKVADALMSLAARYETARLAGRHDGPKLQALRVYEVSWDVRSGRLTTRPPDDRVLFGEVLLDETR
jgi:hypothetical protein